MTVPFRSPPQLRLRREEVCGGTSQPSSRVGDSWALSVTISSVSMLTSSNDQIGGVLRHPRTPQMRPRVRRRRKGGWAALRASAWPSCGPSGPPAARSAVQHLGFVPAPDCSGGQGTVCLSNERLQLVLIQSCPEFPFDSFGHLLPGSPGGFHLFEDIERFYK